jgi:hypothetical protein
METATETRSPVSQISTVQASVTGGNRRNLIGRVWHQLCAEVQDINYVARRSIELQMRLPK